ncbi:hypothetical protein DENIT_70016 [Pseudomonas veronii]|nr:hypothetical protein DENIT_70016 [Pseudomonas veronii]
MHHEPFAIDYIDVGYLLINDALEVASRLLSPASVTVPIHKKASDSHDSIPRFFMESASHGSP